MKREILASGVLKGLNALLNGIESQLLKFDQGVTQWKGVEIKEHNEFELIL